ncbi:DNA-directed RNA polymerase subunit K [Candidatus Woesearchaeota archaeon]|nr:DNA-directed RNA polymerase subunit K [Candidatus Woesearchaeota archaeon]MBT3538134.1 DNA-directed RNA polymerase subunit K [Candidatus Woesearchaeota archaeon]MBT4697507.1 DNA-directed RNA polymerase subunit K [Candidatus Woesearchaeota archaeon]MBT4716849.1 DNA-directed RNA polymerase subunit K [Candidatus Woesearchaeota archaeon]MBT7105803.1 DNA-directed RNA polymerase subunit K [Candidatus Woesearchaeota archaeon]
MQVKVFEEVTTKDRLTKYEKARVLGSRALQLSMGAPMLVKLSKKDLENIHYNPLEIAKIEMGKGVLPLIIARTLPMSSVKEEA